MIEKLLRLSLTILFLSFKICLFAQVEGVYHDSLNDFTIEIPNGWIIEKKISDQPVALSVRLNNINEGGIVPSYVVNIIQAKTALDKFYLEFCRPFDSTNEDRVLISEDNYLTNGIEFKWILIKSKSVDIRRNLTYYCYKDGKIYQISFTADLPGFVKYEHTFKKVIDTFKL